VESEHHSGSVDEAANSRAGFYGFLAQALTLGARKVSQARFPQFAGFLIYAALVALVLIAFKLGDSEIILGSLALLSITGILAVVLLLGTAIHATALTLLVSIVVLGLLGISGGVVHTLSYTSEVPPDDARVYGNVLSDDGVPIAGARVSAGGDTRSGETNADGFFELTVRRSAFRGDSVMIFVRKGDITKSFKFHRADMPLALPFGVAPDPSALNSLLPDVDICGTTKKSLAAALHQEGDRVFASGPLEVALDKFQKAAELCPEVAAYHAAVGSTRIRMLQFEAGLLEMRRSIRMSSQVAWYHNEACVALTVLNRVAEAEPFCRRAIELDSTFIDFQPDLIQDLQAEYSASLESQ
jgi:hypothetical protein